MNSDVTIERTSREVIENKLLAALTEEGGQVAILATEADLVLLISALRAYNTPTAAEMAQDFSKLLVAGFPK